MQVPRIEQLDERTIGHIAAGEVVERPAQVVKECIENSLDAGAERIEIEVQRGGFDSLSIRDDGHGILSDDLHKALDRHATSKLRTHSDLSAIHTLGFRGEALASIGMVSHLSISSRPVGSEGALISMIDGNKGDVEPCGMPPGTLVEVCNLFKNQPARLAFQRRPATEAARIVDVVVQHALANPNCSFKLSVDERMVLNTPSSTDLAERMYDLLGAQASRMLAVESPASDDEAPGDERWSGWISPPEVTRGKGDDVHVLINGRPVASQPFLSAIRRGYKTRLMVGRHPVAVLHLTLPPDEVDVNVHPTKREVRLRHSWRVLERLERAIAYSLSSVPTEPDAGGSIEGLQSLSQGMVSGAAGNPAEAEQNLRHIRPVGKHTSQRPAWAEAASTQLNLGGQIAPHIRSVEPARPISVSPLPQQTLPGSEKSPIAPPLSVGERQLHRHSGKSDSVMPSTEPDLEGVLNDLPVLEPLSQFADSYILVQAGSELLLIDQHALHERIRYERLRHSEQAWAPQTRITPLPLELDPSKAERLSAHQQRLADAGFQFESDVEGGWAVSAAPAIVPQDSVKEFVEDLLQDLVEDEAPLETIERRRDHIAFLQSCRGAVKANEKLNLPEMRRLLEDMRRIPNPWACVHGRPTALRIPLNQLDHHFGRLG